MGIFGLSTFPTKVSIEPAESEKTTLPPKPDKHRPKSLSQLEEGKARKDDLVYNFMHRQRLQYGANLTPEQLSAKAQRMFASLDASHRRF